MDDSWMLVEEMVMIKSERDVRSEVREHWKQDIHFIEQAHGSSFGFPDTIVVKDGLSFCLELKAGQVNSQQRIKFQFRQQQHRRMLRLIKEGLPCYYLVGLKGTTKYWLVDPRTGMIDARTGLQCKGTFDPQSVRGVVEINPKRLKAEVAEALLSTEW